MKNKRNIKKEIELCKYVLKKLKKRDFFGLPEEYKDTVKAESYFKDQLIYWSNLLDSKKRVIILI